MATECGSASLQKRFLLQKGVFYSLCPMLCQSKLMHVGLCFSSLVSHISIFIWCVFLSAMFFLNQSFLPKCPRVSLNTIAETVSFLCYSVALMLTSVSLSGRCVLSVMPSLAVPCCAMPSQQQGGNSLHSCSTTLTGALSLSFSFFFLTPSPSLYPFLHFNTISK